jgi:hypothetical protein
LVAEMQKLKDAMKEYLETNRYDEPPDLERAMEETRRWESEGDE